MRHHPPAARILASALSLLFMLPATAVAQALPASSVERTVLVATPHGLDYVTQHSFRSWSPAGQNSASSSGGSSLLWSIESDGSWIADAISLGNDGTEALIEYGDFQNTIEAHSGHSAVTTSPLILHATSVLNGNRNVVSAAASSAHISAHFESDGSSAQWRASLRKYSLGGSTPDWSFTSSMGQFSTDSLHVGISADGSRVVLIEYDMATVGTRVSVFDGPSGNLLQQFSVMTFSAVRSFALSSDGSTLVMASNQRLAICEVETGTIRHLELLLTTPNYRAVALSGDGSVIAYAGFGDLRSMQRDPSLGYSTAFEEDLGASSYARRIAIAADGSTMAAGIHKLEDGNAVRLLAHSTADYAVLFDVELAGSGSLTNLVEDLECSRDGTRIALGMWGDEDGLLPEVMVFRTASGELLLSEDLSGSVKELALSPDGRTLAVAAKGTHEMIWGGGGSYRLYRLGKPEIKLAGVPVADSLAQLSHSLREGQTGRILVASKLAADPTQAHQYGSGWLYLDPESLVELPLLTADESNSTRQPFQLGAAGSELFFQAVNVDRGTLGNTWLKVTVTP